MFDKHQIKKIRLLVSYHLACIDYTQKSLAEEIGVSPAALNRVFQYPSRRIEEVIIKKTSLPAHEIFPKRYDSDGNRVVKRGRPRSKNKETQ